MYVTAIIPAAGYGLRLKKKIPKALIEINNRPIFIQTLVAISQHPSIKDIIVVAPYSYIKVFEDRIRKYRLKKIQVVIPGGLTRRESVENGLLLLKPKNRWVLIHDAVRPFIGQKIISEVINAARKGGAAIVGLPVKATIKKVKGRLLVEKTLDRNHLWEIQTPQVFKKELILEAYNKFKHKTFTDDASLVERLGAEVRVVMGSYFNIKITTSEDLILAQAIISRKLYENVD